MDIRLRTCCIIERDGHFFRALGIDYLPCWSDSPWDAWRTRDLDAAHRVAWQFGCRVWLFNPVAGQLAVMEGKQ